MSTILLIYFQNKHRCVLAVLCKRRSKIVPTAGPVWSFDTKFAEDIVENNMIDLKDFVKLASHWIGTGCVSPDFCESADLNFDGEVGANDLIFFYPLIVLRTEW